MFRCKDREGASAEAAPRENHDEQSSFDDKRREDGQRAWSLLFGLVIGCLGKRPNLYLPREVQDLLVGLVTFH
jgi:hypothetical protein